MMKIEVRKESYSRNLDIFVSTDEAEIKQIGADSDEAKAMLFRALDACFNGYAECAEYLLERQSVGNAIRLAVKEEQEES